jgi:hypothetical protein
MRGVECGGLKGVVPRTIIPEFQNQKIILLQTQKSSQVLKSENGN